MNEFEAKVARVLNDPTSKYDEGLRRDAELTAAEERRKHSARLRRLAVVAVAALEGHHGPDAQKTVDAALQAFGDVRPEVEALARWDEARRKGEEPLELEKPLILRALEDKRVENSLRGVEAIARESEREKRAKRKGAAE